MSRRSIALAAALVALAAVPAVAPVTRSGNSRAAGPGATTAERAPAATRASAAVTPPRLPAGTALLKVGRPTSSRPIAPGFVGLSFEYDAVAAYAGTDPAAVDPVFVQLIRNLNPGQAPVLRIGGDSTDWTWWPVAGMSQPAGVNYSLGANWADVTHALASALGAKLILGVNLEADSGTVASAEAKGLIDHIGSSSIAGLELGNEPELYAIFNWGAASVKGRAKGYDYADFSQDFTRIGDALPKVPLAGPTIGAPEWFGDLSSFLSTHPRVAVATLHRYPLQLCYVRPGLPNFPTIAHLLSSYSSRVMANTVISPARVAHARGVPLRIDEMNTISCGTDDAVAKSFATALWAVDALFEMARVGVDGVNIHSYPGATYELFTFTGPRGGWRAVVEPEYYGLMMFAQAAPPGSRLLAVSTPGSGQLHAWATMATNGTVRVVAINDGARARTVAVRPTASSAAATGTLERLQAPGLGARSGVTLGGQSFGTQTSTGLLTGRHSAQAVAPRSGEYVFRVPAASAALLTIAPQASAG
ncbi:MAG: glycosyl hydrolase family 79 C-terminal domain-containing protein [Solirubrobacteraceae bacterium]|jgi:hypothetical protein